MSLFNGTFDILREATVFASRRHDLLAQNVANADTPGFQARDLMFAQELTLAQQVKALPADSLETPRLDLRFIEGPDARHTEDGNNVDIDRQMARVSQNAQYHNTVIQLLQSRFSGLKAAINGRA
jgi:flagellar basal-body rod protein FlgB